MVVGTVIFSLHQLPGRHESAGGSSWMECVAVLHLLWGTSAAVSVDASKPKRQPGKNGGLVTHGRRTICVAGFRVTRNCAPIRV